MLLIVFFLTITNFCFGKDLLIFHDKNFLGCLNCSEYDANSICNQYGTYGNEYSGNRHIFSFMRFLSVKFNTVGKKVSNLCLIY